jgi:hypothetical protein
MKWFRLRLRAPLIVACAIVALLLVNHGEG